jgi:flagellar basal-body rod protein FlgB
MFIDNLLNQGNGPLLERVLNFTSARQRLIAENITNLTTPGYKTKDLSVEKFQEMLRHRVDTRNSSPPGTVGFADIDAQIEHPRSGLLFHDGNNRSVEQIMTDNAKNSLTHNLIIELLRKQYSTMEMALKERVG